MGDKPRERGALHVLSHFLPAEALRRASQLAHQFERDRFFRSYVVRRIWFVFPVLLVAAFLLLNWIFQAGRGALGLFAQPVHPAVRYAITGIGVAIWFLGLLCIVYVLFSWMAKRAQRRQEKLARRGSNAHTSRGRVTRLAVVLAIVAGLAYWMRAHDTAEERMRATCATIRPGMTVTELQAFAARHGLLAPSRDGGLALVYLAEKKTFGRHACKVILRQGVVTQSDYNYAD